jgi:hypothetical protein
MKTSTKIWLGVGAFVVVGSGPVSTATVLHAKGLAPLGSLPIDSHLPGAGASSTTVLAQHMRHGGEGGEGEGGEGEGGAGEGGERGAAKLAPDLGFALLTAQLRGHLVVGDELVRQGEWSAALPHFLHPSEEIYGDIRGHLKSYGVPPFAAALKVLADTVKRRQGGADYAKAFKTVEDALARADAGLRAKQSDWAAFVAESALELLKSAAGEYEEAIVGDLIAKPVEYQDARGFVWHAEAMFESVAADLTRKDARAVQ